jgi:hypothetical protein
MCFNINKVLSGSKMQKKDSYEIFFLSIGIRKNWSRDDLLTPQIPAYEVYPDNDS